MELSPKDIAELKEILKREIIEELAPPVPKPRSLGRAYEWRTVHEHLYRRAAEIEPIRTNAYWRIVESVRNLIRPTFKLKRVEYLPPESVQAALKLVDATLDAIKAAREVKAIDPASR